LIFDEVTDKNKLAPFYGPRCNVAVNVNKNAITLSHSSTPGSKPTYLFHKSFPPQTLFRP